MLFQTNSTLEYYDCVNCGGLQDSIEIEDNNSDIKTYEHPIPCLSNCGADFIGHSTVRMYHPRPIEFIKVELTIDNIRVQDE